MVYSEMNHLKCSWWSLCDLNCR